MAFGVARLALAGALWQPGLLARVCAIVWGITGVLNLHTLLLVMGVRLAPPAGSLYLLPWGLSFLLLSVWLAQRSSEHVH